MNSSIMLGWQVTQQFPLWIDRLKERDLGSIHKVVCESNLDLADPILNHPFLSLEMS